jgi:large subunit ribosomal protein L29
MLECVIYSPTHLLWEEPDMAKSDELRDMSDEQLGLTLKDAVDRLFRLKIQSQTERLDAPTELRHYRRLVARVKTIQNQRAKRAVAATAS